MSFQKPGSRSKAAFGVAFRGGGDTSTGSGGRSAAPPLPRAAAAVAAADAAGPLGDAPLAAAAAAAAGLLPAARRRREVLFAVEAHATTILLGDTGSGKTTQVPRFLVEAGWAAGGMQVVCTQPRRMAAVTVAARVAEEMGVKLGEEVGYAVRFEDATSPATRLRYATDGALLREVMADPLLSRYSVVMVDEAHERSLATDVLLGLLKKVQRRRPDLRVIVSSATLEADRLAAFFDPSGRAPDAAASASAAAAKWAPGAPPARAPAIVSLAGRAHPVQVHYLTQPTPDYVQSAATTAIDLHKEDVPGDVLIFLTGQEEVERAVGLLREAARELGGQRLAYRMVPLPLYSGLPAAATRAAFEPAARGVRKVVVATNIAETSLTLEGVVYVIDSCFVKQRCYDPSTGLEALQVAPAPASSLAQRAGRAGRVRPGHCFRLCTEEAARALPAAAPPEMQRSDLAGLLLQLKALGIDNVLRFDWPAPPPAEAVARGLETLHALGAIDGDARLTRDVGLPLAALPLEPQLGAAVLAAAAAATAAGRPSRARHMLLAAGLLSVPSVWAHARGGARARARDAQLARFAVAEGDVVSYLNAHRAWADNGRSAKWAARHHVHHHGLARAEEIARQLRARLIGMGRLPRPRQQQRHQQQQQQRRRRAGGGGGSDEDEDDDSDELDIEALVAAIAAGYFANAAEYERTEYDPRAAAGDAGTHVYRLLRHPVTPAHGGGGGGGPKLRIHASSVLWRVRPELVVFARCAAGEGGWHDMQGVTAVPRAALGAAAPHFFRFRGRG